MLLLTALRIKSNHVLYSRPLFSKLVRCMSKLVTENKKVLVLHHEDKGIVSVTLKYVNEDLRINKGFHFNRKSTEKCSHALARISDKINECIIRKNPQQDIKQLLVKVNVISKTDRNNDVESLSCLDCFVNVNNYLKIGNKEYQFEINPPRIISIELPKKVILAGFILYPSQIKGYNFNISDSNFKWYVSRRKFEFVDELNIKTLSNYTQEWKEIGEGFQIFINKEHISRYIKVVAIPGKEELKGPQVQAISSNLVSEISEFCPFEHRHHYTPLVLPKDFEKAF
ncbi:hypothetical protein Anas_10891, partial [Armadillidium nasatum]